MNTQMISHQDRSVPPGAIDVWSQSQAGSQLGFHQPPASGSSPVQKVQRLLRGKVAWAIVLGLIGALLGAAAGYLSQSPEYRALGKLEIRPTIERLGIKDSNISFYQQFMASQAQTIASPRILNMIPQTEPWKSSKYANDPQALAAVGSGLKTTYLKNTFNIDVQIDAEDKDLAAIGVQSVINAYQSQYKSNTIEGLERKIREFEARARELESQSRSAEKLINDLTSKYGSDDLAPRVSALQREVEDIARELRGYENNFKAAVGAIEAMRNGQVKTPIEELAQVDAGLAQMLQDIKAMSLKLQMMRSKFGDNHPNVRDLRAQLDAISQAAEQYADTLRKEILAIIPDFVKGGYMKVTPGQLRVLEARVVQLKADLAEYEKRRDALAADAGKVASYKLAIKDANDDLTKVREQLNELRFLAASQGDLTVMNDGRYPAPIQNKRVMFGLLGGMVGCVIPVGLLMLLGLMDTRFKYSDDAAGSSMSGIPLLGILPNLPDRLSDPAQASIAAHCVHQIRTMLQLNAMRQEGATVFSITSASSGDGKTSLSLALGLSFAASGSRTLLIDADLVGGGLTSRLGNNSPLGIVDALAGVNLDDCIQPTDVADLSILPIGSAQAHHAGGFSPPAVRKLLGEVRKRYEVILIDTGPIMGSIEATPICASVDGVVLTVARGQSRPLVERAITHLQSIGARICGVVFNRAQHKDFEQSIGAISIRSAARSTVNGSGHNARNPGDIGAVAKAVATSVRNEN